VYSMIASGLRSLESGPWPWPRPRPRPRTTFKAKAKAKDLDPMAKAKAKDLSHKAKAKAKDLDFGLKDQGQGQGLTSLTFALARLSCSYWFDVKSGVRQGSVLSPGLFAVFMNLFIACVRSADLGCYVNGSLVSCVLYADDIIFLSASLTALQNMLEPGHCYCNC